MPILDLAQVDRDAYSAENQFIANKMAEAESVSARKATLLNPTEDDETVQVLRRRLFERIDDQKAGAIIDAYRQLWTTLNGSYRGKRASCCGSISKQERDVGVPGIAVSETSVSGRHAARELAAHVTRTVIRAAEPRSGSYEQLGEQESTQTRCRRAQRT